jgi:hypothetical protein
MVLLNIILVFLSLPLFVFSSRSEPKIAVANTWNISRINLSRFTTVPIDQYANFSASFLLHRTIPVACPSERGPPQKEPRGPCGWRPSPIATQCEYGFTNKDILNVWRNCQTMSDMPEGEDEVLPDTQRRLKWRILDLQESIGEGGGAYKGVSKNGRSFKAVTIEVVQVFPNKS